MSKSMNLNFNDIETPAETKPDADTARRVAAKAGSAEGFTGRTSVRHESGMPSRRTNHIQMNFKVPEEFRERFQQAYLVESENNRSIRSFGEFLVMIFEEWKNRAE